MVINNPLEADNILVLPGEAYFSEEDKLLSAIAGSGVALTLFDKKRKCGGMCYFIRPLRKIPSETSTLFACPAIIGLLNMLIRSGSKLKWLEAQLHGGAENAKAEGYIRGLGDHNVRVAKEILELKNIRITGMGVGGSYGRKVVFNTISGEIIIAKVDNIRATDWYPPLITSKQNER